MGRKKNLKKSNGAASPESVGEESGSDNNVNGKDTDLFTCENSPIFGRYLKTRVDIKKGTLLLSEKYLVAGPMRSSGLICLGCHSEFRERKIRKACSKCKWPVCGETCSNSLFHRDECQFFVENNVQPLAPKNGEDLEDFDFGAITILRGLLLKLNDEASWRVLQELEHHSPIRRRLPLWEENMKSVVEPLGKGLGLSKYFTEDEIHDVCGVLEVNAFELGEEFSYRGIFPTAAMMAHDCIPNATHFEDTSQGIIQVRATADIPCGTPITVCYAYALQGTAQRRRMLIETKFFECTCERCCSPTELDTQLSTLLCPACQTGLVVNTKAKEKEILWQCQSCDTKMDRNEVGQLVDKYLCSSESVQGIKACETFLQETSKFFHRNHFIPLGIKFNLCQAYGREATPLHELTQVELERKLALCLEVLETLNVITPGSTVTRGLILYELQATEIILSRRVFESRRFSKALLKRRLEGTVKVLMEAISILSLAHETTSEYSMAMSARNETLPDLKRWITILKTKS